MNELKKDKCTYELTTQQKQHKSIKRGRGLYAMAFNYFLHWQDIFHIFETSSIQTHSMSF